jgi:hypothetical protein
MGFSLEENAHRTEAETHYINIKSTINPNGNAQNTEANARYKKKAQLINPIKRRQTPKSICQQMTNTEERLHARLQ